MILDIIDKLQGMMMISYKLFDFLCKIVATNIDKDILTGSIYHN